MILTVVAVTAPLLAAGPNALTQSPTASSLAVADWVVLTVVELDVVIMSCSFLGVAGFLAWVLDPELDTPRPAKPPGENVLPVSVTVDPITAVTWPVATDSDASCLGSARAPPSGKLGRLPPVSPPWGAPCGGVPPPRPPKAPLAPDPKPTLVHKPPEAGVVTVMERAAIVVFDFFDAVPVTETQSPAASVLTAWDTVFENAVVDVQVTVV